MSKSLTRSSIWQCGAYLKPQWRFMVIAALAGFVRLIFPLFFPYFMKRVIDTVLTPAGLSRAERLDNLFPLLWLTAAVFVLHGIATVVRLYFARLADQDAVKRIRADLFESIQRQEISFFQERPTGAIVSRVMNDVALTESIFDVIFIQVFQDVLKSAAILIILFGKNFILGLIAVSMVPLYLITTRIISSKMRLITSRVQEVIAAMGGFLTEHFSNILVVQSFTKEEEEKADFTKQVDTHKRLRLKLAWLTSLLTSFSELITGLGQVLIIVLCAWQVLAGKFTIGEMTAFVMYAGMLYGPIQALTMRWAQIQEAEACGERVFEFMRRTPAIKDNPGAEALKVTKAEIVFERVNFSYPQEEPVTTLHDINLRIPEGGRAALVGPSGSGKTTLVNLIPRFFDVDSGRILIDGRDISKITRRSLRRAISIVPQKPMLFSGSIRENISYGRPDCKAAEIIQAARDANAEEFILKQEGGFNSIIGEDGGGLSGGQIQRIAIARAFLKAAPIIILDEATSALDVRSEALIQEALTRLLKNRTSITIAHRLSTVQHADLILVMQSGRIVEQGNHHELLARGGIYAGLVNSQLLTP